MRRALLVVVAALALAGGLAVAWQTPPNLSGAWTLDIPASEFAKEPPPQKKVVLIEHVDPKLTMTVAEEGPAGPVKATGQYRTDGTPSVNDVFGNQMTTVAKWDAAVLVMTTTGRFGDNEITLVDRYALSADGRTLTVRRHFEGKQRGGVQDQVLVHRKQ
jgi:hypothetical protein